jgi:hypothetical protein
MKASKVKVTIETETLDIDSVGALVMEALDQISREAENGHLRTSDGDQVSWKTEREPVEF